MTNRPHCVNCGKLLAYCTTYHGVAVGAAPPGATEVRSGIWRNGSHFYVARREDAPKTKADAQALVNGAVTSVSYDTYHVMPNGKRLEDAYNYDSAYLETLPTERVMSSFNEHTGDYRATAGVFCSGPCAEEYAWLMYEASKFEPWKKAKKA